MRQVYYYKITVHLNDFSKVEHSKWGYGEPKHSEAFKVPFSVDEIFTGEGKKWYNYYERLFSSKRNVYIRCGSADKAVKEEDITSLYIECAPIAVDTNEVSVSDLMEKLSAEDFVEWWRDKGFTSIPINK